MVFDSSPLNYFTRAGCLHVLESLTSKYERFTTEAVRNELLVGEARHPELSEVRQAAWLQVATEDPATLATFAVYTRQIGRNGKNLGEASVLAWAKTHGATAVLDDQTGFKLAKREGITVTRSLTLIAEGVRTQILSDSQAEVIVDQLRDAEAYFPCSGSEFLSWARQQGHL
jgi:predicted nucleic acid-binding protein